MSLFVQPHNAFQPSPSLIPQSAFRKRAQRMTDLPLPTQHMVSLRPRANTEGGKGRFVPSSGCRRDSRSLNSFNVVELAASSPDPPHRTISQDGRSSVEPLPSQGERPESLARSLFSRSTRILKQQNSKFNLASLRTLQWLEDTDEKDNSKDVHELSGRRLSKQSSTSIYREPGLRHAISEPYNFQHLTHTGADQFREMHTVSDNELVTEFSAIRAAQAPNLELKGIRAESLPKVPPSPYFPLGHLSSGLVDSTAPSSPTKVLSRDRSGRSDGGVQQGLYDLPSHSLESFTRISSRSFSSPTPPVSPMSKGSSKFTHKLLLNHRDHQESLTTPILATTINNDESTASEYTSSLMPRNYTSACGGRLDELDQSFVGHAVTTPDDTAYPLWSDSFEDSSDDLDHVPREEERYRWTSVPNLKSNKFGSGVTMRHIKSLPGVNCTAKKPESLLHLPSSTEILVSCAWDAPYEPMLHTPDQSANDIPIMPRMSRQMSTGLKAFGDRWEDDIDYCYEHAAEADCDFNWDQNSTTTANSIDLNEITTLYSGPTAESQRSNESSNGDTVKGLETAPDRMSRIGLSRLAIPGPDTASVESLQSSSISVSEVNTPSQAIIPSSSHNPPVRSLCDSDLFTLNSSMPSPYDYDSIFQDPTSEGLASKHYYPMYDHRISAHLPLAESSRSSGTALSKCTSLDSILVSRAGSLYGHDRSNDSVSSLPDLVYSKTRRQAFDIVTEQLTEHIASLTGHDLPMNESSSGLPPSRRRNHSLAKEAGRQSILKTATSFNSIKEADDEEDSDDAIVILPSPERHSRACRNACHVASSPAPSTRSSVTTRTRSTSSASTMSPNKSTRASYRLFPTAMAASSS